MLSRHSSTRNRMLHSIRFMRVPPSIYRYFFGSCRRHVLCHLLMHDRWVDQNYSPNQRCWYNQKGNKNIDCRSSHLDSSQNGGPDWKTWASRQQQENEKVSDKKPILFATIIIISLIAVENGIFLELLHLFMTFVLKHANNFLLLFYTLKKKMLQFQNSNHDDFIISSWYIAFNFVAAAVYIYGIVFSNINSLTMRLLHQYCCPLMHFF